MGEEICLYVQRKIPEVAIVSMNRPKVHNALNGPLVEELIKTLKALAKEDRLRLLVLEGKGPSFCSGADLQWMQEVASKSKEENVQDASKLSELLSLLFHFPTPVMGLAQGRVMGGGVGLLACADFVLCERKTIFALSEVRVGLIPAVISPYLLKRIPYAQLSWTLLTGKSFNAEKAQELGLVHEVVEENTLPRTFEFWVQEFLKGAPGAQREAKKLLRLLQGPSPQGQMVPPALDKTLAETLARLRHSEEAREGLLALKERRAPRFGIKLDSLPDLPKDT